LTKNITVPSSRSNEACAGAGDAALVTGLVTLKARSRAGGYNGRFGVVDVYMKRAGRRQLALSTGEHAKLLTPE
jgi:hypothetical protein